jgi:hypothetical protein
MASEINYDHFLPVYLNSLFAEGNNKLQLQTLLSKR